MSVYTEVSLRDAEIFLRDYNLSPVTDLVGVVNGIENTNYFLTTEQGSYVLTLFEQCSPDDLSYPLALMGFLADQGIPSARPIANQSGQLVGQLHTKPAIVVERLQGASVEVPGESHLLLLGATLGRFHRIGLEFECARPDARGLDWLSDIASLIHDRLSSEEQGILDRSITRRTQYDALCLPQGVIHADLFRDNVLFSQNRVSGLIDFYDAHNGPLVYDLAVTVCDWCIDERGNLNGPAAAALVHAYSREKSLNVHERQAWVESLRAAGLRFWLSRKKDQLIHREGAITQRKRPQKFAAIIEACDRRSEHLQTPLQ